MAGTLAASGNADESPFLGGIARYLHPEARDLPGQAAGRRLDGNRFFDLPDYGWDEAE